MDVADFLQTWLYSPVEYELFVEVEISPSGQAWARALKHTPHNFTRARLGQFIHKLYGFGAGNRAQVRGDVLAQFFTQFRRCSETGAQQNVSINGLALDFVAATRWQQLRQLTGD